MRQKSMNESMKSRGKTMEPKNADIMEIDDMLDDEGWDILNGLTEEELEQLNSDFDPENSLIAVGDRSNHKNAVNAAPMFTKENLLGNLEKMVAKSKPVIKNEMLRKKEEERKKLKELELDRKYLKKPKQIKDEMPKHIALTKEEEELLNSATEEELIEAAEHALQQHQYELREKLLHTLQKRQHDGGQISQNLSSYINGISNHIVKTYGESSESSETTTIENDSHLFYPLNCEHSLKSIDENNNKNRRHQHPTNHNDESFKHTQKQKCKAKEQHKEEISLKNCSNDRIRKINDEKNESKSRIRKYHEEKLDSKDRLGKCKEDKKDSKVKSKTKSRKSSTETKIEYIKLLNEKRRKYSEETITDSETTTIESISDTNNDSNFIIIRDESFHEKDNIAADPPLTINCNVSVDALLNKTFEHEEERTDELLIKVDIDINLDSLESKCLNPINISTDVSDQLNEALTKNSRDQHLNRNDIDLKYNIEPDDNVTQMIEHIQRRKSIKRPTTIKKQDTKTYQDNIKEQPLIKEPSKIKELSEKITSEKSSKVPAKQIKRSLTRDKFGFNDKSTNKQNDEKAKHIPSKLALKTNNPFLKNDKEKLCLQSKNKEVKTATNTTTIYADTSLTKQCLEKDNEDYDSGIDRSHSVFSMCTPTDFDSRIDSESDSQELDKFPDETLSASENKNSNKRLISPMKIKTFRKKSFDRSALRKQKSCDKLEQTKFISMVEEQKETKSEGFKRVQKDLDRIGKSKNKMKNRRSIENLDQLLKQHNIVQQMCTDDKMIKDICNYDNIQTKKSLNQFNRNQRKLSTESYKHNENKNDNTSQIQEKFVETKTISNVESQPKSGIPKSQFEKKNSNRHRKKSDPFRILNKVKSFNSAKTNDNDLTSALPVEELDNKHDDSECHVDITDGNLCNVIKNQKNSLKKQRKKPKLSVEEKIQFIKNLNANNKEKLEQEYTNVVKHAEKDSLLLKKICKLEKKETPIKQTIVDSKQKYFREEDMKDKKDSSLHQLLNKDHQKQNKVPDNNKKTADKNTSNKSFLEKLKHANKSNESSTEESLLKTNQSNNNQDNESHKTNRIKTSSPNDKNVENYFSRRKKERQEKLAAESEDSQNPFASSHSEEPKLSISRNKIPSDDEILDSSSDEETKEMAPKVLTYEKDYFAERRKARQMRLQDDNFVETYNFEEKLSASQQIDLLNLQREKEKEARRLMEEIEKIKQAVETKKPVVKDAKKQEIKSPVIKKTKAEHKKTEIPRVVVNSPIPERKLRSPQVQRKTVQVDNTKEKGLEALENIRSKLRKVPKVEIKNDDEEDDEPSIEIDVSEKRRKMIENVNGEAKPGRRSALEMLLEKDAGGLEKKREEQAKAKETVIDCRGVTASLLQNALLKMNGMLTNDQINSVFAGEKPTGESITSKSSVKATPAKSKMIQKHDVETELDVVELMRCLKENTDDLFYICINNQPKLEKSILQEVFRAVESSSKVKHLSLAMTGIIDNDIKQLSKAIRYNEQLETLNLESNVIGMSGIDALMKVVARHPSLREVKVSNQKQPFGGNGEECMAKAIDQNENILKFGYSFKQAGPRNKADRAIIRHNENLRQRRRTGEDVYDLKATCKIRDPWPQPWIRVKGRRLLGGLIESKASAMGRMIDVDSDVRRESRGPKLRDQEAKPLDINALLSQRKNKLKGSKVADLEEIQEEKRKRLFLEMQEEKRLADEAERVKNEPPPPPKEEAAARDIVQLDDEDGIRRRRNRRSSFGDDDLNSGDVEDSPPTDDESKTKIDTDDVSQKKKLVRGVGANIVALTDDDEKTSRRRRNRRHEDENEEGLDFGEFETETTAEEKENDVEEIMEEVKEEEEVKETPAERKKRLSREGGKHIVANLDTDEDVPRRRRRQRQFSDDEDTNEVNETEVVEEEKEEEEIVEKVEEKTAKKASLLGKAKPIASLSPNAAVIGRRKKKVDDLEEIDPFANVSQKIAKLPSPDVIRRRRRNRGEDDDAEEEDIDFEKIAKEQKLKEEAELKRKAEEEKRKKAEEEKQKKLEEERRRKTSIDERKKKLSVEGGRKVAALDPLDPVMPRRRRRQQLEDEPEENEFLKVEPKKEEEPAKEPEPEVVQEVAKTKEEKRLANDELLERKKKLSRDGGVKVASLAPLDDAVPRRRRKTREPEDEEEKQDVDVKKKDAFVKTLSKDKIKVREEDTPREEPKKRFTGVGSSKKVAALPPAEEVASVRRRKKISVEEKEDEKVNPIDLVEKSEKNAIVNASKKIKGLEPVSSGITPIRRRRKQYDDEEENIDPFSSVKQEEGTKKKQDEPKVVEEKPKNTSRKPVEKVPEVKEEDERPTRRGRTTRQRDDDDETAPVRVSRFSKPKEKEENNVQESGTWYTDEETKQGDRRVEESPSDAPTFDLFSKDNDNGAPKKLSLRERMARRGR